MIFGLVFVTIDFEVGTAHPLQRVDSQSLYEANFHTSDIHPVNANRSDTDDCLCLLP